MQIKYMRNFFPQVRKFLPDKIPDFFVGEVVVGMNDVVAEFYDATRIFNAHNTGMIHLYDVVHGFANNNEVALYGATHHFIR